MAFYTSDVKTPLLPDTIAEVEETAEAQQLTRPDRQRRAIEATLQYINLVLSSFQLLTLYFFSNTHPPYSNRHSEVFSLLARGLFTSMPIAAVTAIVPFIAIPYIVQPGYKKIVRNLVVCSYLMSTLLCALLVGSPR